MQKLKEFFKKIDFKKLKPIWEHRYIILSVVAAVVLLISVITIISIYAPSPEIKEIQQIASIPVITESSDGKPTNPINFAELKAVNSDIYAWVTIPDTPINYPILKSASEDYYLDHDINKKKSPYGAPYTQSYNSDDFSDFNTVVYGHNMINGQIFGSLKKYRNREYFDKNNTVYVYTPERILKYKIFAAYNFDDRHLILSYSFDTPLDKVDYLTPILTGVYGGNVNSELVINEFSKILTLSTCSVKDEDRFLVQAVLIEDTNLAE